LRISKRASNSGSTLKSFARPTARFALINRKKFTGDTEDFHFPESCNHPSITVNSELDFPHPGSEAFGDLLSGKKRPIRLSL
jgi:hypothetical protein